MRGNQRDPKFVRESVTQAIALGCLLVMGGCLAARIYTARAHPQFSMYRHLTPSHLRVDALFAGVFLSYLVLFHGRVIECLRRWRIVLFMVGVACYIPPGLWPIESTPFIHTWGFSVLTLGAMLITLWAWFSGTSYLLPSADSHPLPGTLGRGQGEGSSVCEAAPSALVKLLAAVGLYSYSIYLWHLPFATGFAKGIWGYMPFAGRPWAHLLFAPFYVVLAIAVGAVLHRALEAPALALRDRLFPRRQKAAIGEPAGGSGVPARMR
jgi:peptidoglycan/LPS O-acetylase OafA/YrhL